MMQNLKTDPVRVTLELVKYPDEGAGSEGEVISPINGRIHTQPTHFHAIKCRAFNAAGSYLILL